MTQAPTPLATTLAARMVEEMRAGGVRPGERLTERKLAERFRVSRSPVRRALRLLADAGVLTAGERGLEVADLAAADAALPPGRAGRDEDEAAYLRLADDRVGGRLPARITENELMRRYGLTRARLARLLRRMAQDGWIERLPGHGWSFLPVPTSREAYGDGHRFRLAIEPAALLEPRWTLNRAALEARREEQAWLARGGAFEVADARLLEMNSGLHGDIMACSRNGFFIDALRRVDRLRRLIDDRPVPDRAVAVGRCREHVEILDLVLRGRNEEASACMARHLGALPGPGTVARKGAARPAARGGAGAR